MNKKTPIIGLNSIKNHEKSPTIAHIWAFLMENHINAAKHYSKKIVILQRL